MSRVRNGLERLVARLRSPFLPAAAPLTPSRVALAGEVLRWVRDYLGAPHPQLGRSGPVCPFARPSLETDSIAVAFDEADGASRTALQAAALRHARAFARALLRGDASSSLVVVFPRLPPERFGQLDELHTLLKTRLMRADVMCAAIHPRSEKPALYNPAFHVLRAPFAAFVFRKMDVRDIVFLSDNAQAFAHYDARFGALFARGAISDEFGHATAYAKAKARFATR